MRRSKRAVAVTLSATAVLLVVGLLWPRASSANLGGRAEVRRVELAYRTIDGSSAAHFYTAAGPVVTLPLERDQDVTMLLGMVQALAADRGRMWIDLNDGRVVNVVLSAGR